MSRVNFEYSNKRRIIILSRILTPLENSNQTTVEVDTPLLREEDKDDLGIVEIISDNYRKTDDGYLYSIKVLKPGRLYKLPPGSIFKTVDCKPVFNLPIDYTKLHQWDRRLVREQYIVEQGGNCYYCNEDLTRVAPNRITNKKINWDNFPDNFMKSPIHLQHNHNTGMTEGAAHSYCNAVLWQYENK